MFMCCVFTILFASFRLYFFSIVPVSLRSQGFLRLRLVRLRPFVLLTDSVFFLAGFQARWPSPCTIIFAMLVVSMLSLCRASFHLLSSLPICHETTSNLFHHPSKPLFGYVIALLSPSYRVASCRWSCRLFHVGTCLLLGYNYIILSTLMHLYTW